MKSAKKSSPKKAKATKRTKAKKSPGKPGRIGVFGGGFDPFHNGHLNSLHTVAKALGLKEVKIIPAYQSPLRNPVQGSAPEHRLEMVRQGIAGAEDWLQVDDREIQRGGVSYTIDTLRELKRELGRETLYLVIGMDQFERFDRWREFAEILEMADLVVTSRPGVDLPQSIERFPEGVKPLVKRVTKASATLKTKHTIHFIQLEDVEVSATEVRRQIRDHQTVTNLVPEGVANYIRDHGLYETVAKNIGDFERFTHQCADWLIGKGAINVQAYDLRELSGPTEYTLIASGTSTRHTSALAEFLSREVKTQLGVWPQGVEGVSEGRWVVLDYGSLIIHVFYDYLRQEYRLEDLWAKGKALKMNPSAATKNLSPTSTKPLLPAT